MTRLLCFECYSIAEANEGRGEIIVRNPKLDEKEAPKSFTFDAVFGDNCTQKGVRLLFQPLQHQT